MRSSPCPANRPSSPSEISSPAAAKTRGGQRRGRHRDPGRRGRCSGYGSSLCKPWRRVGGQAGNHQQSARAKPHLEVRQHACLPAGMDDRTALAGRVSGATLPSLQVASSRARGSLQQIEPFRVERQSRQASPCRPGLPNRTGSRRTRAKTHARVSVRFDSADPRSLNVATLLP